MKMEHETKFLRRASAQPNPTNVQRNHNCLKSGTWSYKIRKK